MTSRSTPPAKASSFDASQPSTSDAQPEESVRGVPQDFNPPSEPEEPEKDEDAMMASMGFASFGSQTKLPKAKKRKKDHHGNIVLGSGSNTMPLGNPRSVGGGAHQGGAGGRTGAVERRGGGLGQGFGTGIIGGRGTAAAAISRRNGADGMDAEGGGVTLPASVGMPVEDYEDPRYDDDDDAADEDMPAPQYQPSVPQNPLTNALADKPASSIANPMRGAPGTGGAGWGQGHGGGFGQGLGLGQRRADGKRDDGSWDWQALRRGVRDERGDVAFYDQSFVEDPWKHLKAKVQA